MPKKKIKSLKKKIKNPKKKFTKYIYFKDLKNFEYK